MNRVRNVAGLDLRNDLESLKILILEHSISKIFYQGVGLPSQNPLPGDGVRRGNGRRGSENTGVATIQLIGRSSTASGRLQWPVFCVQDGCLSNRASMLPEPLTHCYHLPARLSSLQRPIIIISGGGGFKIDKFRASEEWLFVLGWGYSCAAQFLRMSLKGRLFLFLYLCVKKCWSFEMYISVSTWSGLLYHIVNVIWVFGQCNLI